MSPIRAFAALLIAAAAAGADMPEDIAAKIEAYQVACDTIDKAAAAKLEKERQALDKALTRIAERERKAKRDDVADAVTARLDELTDQAKSGAAEQR